MLDLADLIAAKIVHQLGWAPRDALQARLRALRAGAPGWLLGDDVRLSPEQAGLVRRCSARYQVVVAEAALLRELLARGLEPAEEVELLAAIESEGHQRRLVDVARERRCLDPRALWEAEEGALRGVRRQFQAFVERYVREDFAPVARPLIPDGTIHEDTLRVSRVFRDAPTQVAVRRAITQLQQETRAQTTQVVLAASPPAPAEEPRPHAAPPPRTLGPYRVVRTLGVGGMSEVYLARGPDGQDVAVKVLTSALPEDTARFAREGRILEAISHPGVGRLLDRGRTDDGRSYLVTPATPGRSLREAIRRHKVSLAHAFAVLEQLADVLEAVHRAGVVHRDVKPEHVLMLPRGGRVQLLDFGSARFVGEAEQERTFETRQGTVIGSPAYLPPEAISAGVVDPRMDLYSYGVLAFELLTGTLPFTAPSPGELVAHHLLRAPPTLSERRPDLYWCPELEHLVASLLAKTPAQRPPSAAHVRDALRAGLTRRSLELLTEPQEDLSSSFEG